MTDVLRFLCSSEELRIDPSAAFKGFYALEAGRFPTLDSALSWVSTLRNATDAGPVCNVEIDAASELCFVVALGRYGELESALLAVSPLPNSDGLLTVPVNPLLAHEA